MGFLAYLWDLQNSKLMLQCSMGVLAASSVVETVFSLKLESCCLGILGLSHQDVLFDCVEEGAKIFGCLMDIERQLRD